MDRLPPFDKIGALPVPDFQNADPANSNPGSIVNALVFNQLQREGVNLEFLAGLTPDSANLFQWTQAVSRGGVWVDELTGTGDLAVATLDAVLPAFLRGMRIGGVAAAPNTVTNPKLRVMNLGSAGGYVDYPIFKEDGSSLGIGDIKAGRRYRYEADGAGNVMISGGGLASITNITQALLANVKLTTFSAAQQTPLTNNAYASLIFTDASTADFTNNGVNGFAVKTAGLYSIALQGYTFTNVTGQSTNDVSQLIMLNGQQIAAGKAPYTALASGTFTENTYASVIAQLAVGDIVKATAGVSVGPPSFFGNANASGHQLSFTKIF
ncbi:hypothetical protein [Methylobacterium brachiatum]|uniref:hypothetical protein n=1 Tax=Methylobacterium brachiatum TaxID=269660 RepID=UPI0008EEBC7C|nr:hypothetical protein [Methylobacterium brachiatum]SFJ67700.1 hypothetical protein SAMN02799642_05134 [Methylobacterium brachiatum]